jgi:formamidopyrimidine-DNA glycosylase
MPELPEVETVRMGLQPVLEHRRITHTETRRGDLRTPFPKGFAKRLAGRRVNRLWRRAKYLLADLDNGESLVIHLGMSGRMSVYAAGRERRLGQYVYDSAPPEAGRGKHDHVMFETDAPARIVFTDPRRFGLMTLIATDRLDRHPLFKGLGVEPLSDHFDAAFLEHAFAAKKTPVKSALLDQRVIAGLGNIYVCEALYRSHLSPRRLAATLATKAGQRKGNAGGEPTDHARRLVAAIHAVLDQAIKAGGSSLRDHRQTSGELGYFQHSFQVYDREGEKCQTARCGGIVRRFTQNGRSTFWCPKCQK